MTAVWGRRCLCPELVSTHSHHLAASACVSASTVGLASFTVASTLGSLGECSLEISQSASAQKVESPGLLGTGGGDRGRAQAPAPLGSGTPGSARASCLGSPFFRSQGAISGAVLTLPRRPVPLFAAECDAPPRRSLCPVLLQFGAVTGLS